LLRVAIDSFSRPIFAIPGEEICLVAAERFPIVVRRFHQQSLSNGK
jgi:hypothetical protein